MSQTAIAMTAGMRLMRRKGRERYPARTPDLAAEERQRRADFLARLAREHEGEDSGPRQ